MTLSRRLFGAVGAALLLLAALAACGADDLDRPSPERRVYDLAGVLTTGEAADLEARARTVDQLGHPIVIYLHKKDANYEKTVRDARRLMEAWDVQSAANAHDGLVLLFNVKPSDPAHGSYALVAGKALIESRLPQYELDRVAHAMRPSLSGGRVGGAIAGALDQIAGDLRQGPPPPPPPSASERLASQIATGLLSPFNLTAILIAGVALWLTARGGSHGRPAPQVSSAAEPPSGLAPALAGALATGYVDDADVAATILDFAKRGALAIEPEGKKHARIRLIDASVARPGYERRLWEILKSRANDAGIITSKQMARLQTDWSEVRDGIRQDLVARGWLDPEAGRRRRPLFLRGVGLDLLAV
ncbi:MAG TPA: TPM domain-containing protein, partial [Candidatus Binatia bacterium]|nr:TPM domain-containing protein [Candidatus Binatia bacterium]